jgi:hypothetical protein
MDTSAFVTLHVVNNHMQEQHLKLRCTFLSLTETMQTRKSTFQVRMVEVVLDSEMLLGKDPSGMNRDRLYRKRHSTWKRRKIHN